MQARSILVIFVALVVTSGCGVIWTDIDPIGAPAEVIVDPSVSCGCAGAIAYRLHSLDPDEPIATIYYENIDGTEFARGPVRIEDDGYYPLGCSKQPDPPTPGSCGMTVSYSVPDRYKFATTREQQLVLNGLLMTGRKIDCNSECDDGNGHWPYCLRAKRDSEFAEKFGDQLENLHTKLQDEGTEVIEYSELLDIFDLKGSECARSNITIGDGTAENDGSNFCKISVELELVDKEDTDHADLLIPHSVESTVDRSAQNKVTMLFSNPIESLALKYSDAGLDRYFGGILSEIISAPDYMILKAPNACTRIPF